MRLVISNEIFEGYPELAVGVVVVKGVDNAGDEKEIGQLLREVEEKVKDEFSKIEAPTRHPNIMCWREAYKKFGADPHEYRCSSEALVRQVLKGNNSLKYVLTAGGEDLDKMKGDLVLDFANGDEPFVRLGSVENELPEKGEVAYKDDEGVICRSWNWREGDKTKLTENTKNAILAIEGITPISKAEVETSTGALAELIQKYCGGNIEYSLLDIDKKN